MDWIKVRLITEAKSKLERIENLMLIYERHGVVNRLKDLAYQAQELQTVLENYAK